MVSVTSSLSAAGLDARAFEQAAAGLDDNARQRLTEALEFARSVYGERSLGTGEPAFPHAVAMAVMLAALDLDLDTRIAALLFDASADLDDYQEVIAKRFGDTVAQLIAGLHRLAPLRLLTQKHGGTAELKADTEILRKMLLAMVADIRVVLLRLASRTRTLRWLTDHETAERENIARESLEIYAPLANRLGVWQFKWELEDISFRFLEPAAYKHIAKMLDERRVEREAFIASAVARLKNELAAVHVDADVYGRPKHIYSIWNKMRAKNVDFGQVYDVRALRIIVEELKDCYTALGIVHHLWQPIGGEFDDYIAHPKSNDYRSLHTAVIVEDGRALEVQIRTREMHQHAELGVAAHWRYKEAADPGKSAARADGAYDDKIAWLRQLLSWRDEITDSSTWIEHFKQAALDDTIYVLTPQGRVIDLPRGATPIDFAYRLHSDLGHRCRGARVDGQMVPLNRPLANGQRVEIVSVRDGGPSRDWLNPTQGYLATGGARRKVRQWFAAQEEAELLAQGRAFVTRELQREGHSQANLEELARTLGFRDIDAMFIAAAHGELGMRQIQIALRGAADVAPSPELQTKRSRAGDSKVLIVGVDKLLTQLGRCCKPAPPDAITGFVTRGKGVSIHRVECVNFRNMAARNPERVIGAEWGQAPDALYAVDLAVEANDRQGLLRDISEVFSKQQINVTAVKTLSRSGMARMAFTVELPGVGSLQKVLTLLGEVAGVVSAKRI